MLLAVIHRILYSAIHITCDPWIADFQCLMQDVTKCMIVTA